MTGLGAANALAVREVRRFFRQRSRVIGSLLAPLLAWVFFGLGFGTNVAPTGSGETFSQHFFPGALLLSSVFVAVFASISLIEDRHEGFLQGVLVAPTPRWAIVLGKVFGGTAIAVLHGLLFLCLVPAAGLAPSCEGLLLAVVAMTCGAASLAAVGFYAAWYLDSSQGFHSFMNTALMPAWALSGAFFSTDTWPAWGRAVLWLNPLQHSYEAMRAALVGSQSAGFVLRESVLSLAFGVVFFGLSTYAVGRAQTR